MLERKKNHLLTIISILVGLSVIFGIIDFSILSYERKKDIEEEKTHLIRQMKFIGWFSTEPFLKDNYPFIEEIYQKFGQENPEIAYLKIYTDQTSLLFQYERKNPALEPFSTSYSVKHEGQTLMTIQMELDVETIHEQTESAVFIQLLFLVVSTCFLVILGGIALWRTIQKTAIIPLQDEIERRNRAEQSLKKNEQRYHLLFNESNDAIFIHIKGKVIDVNQKACELLGFSQDELMSKNIAEVYAGKARERVTERKKGEEKKGGRTFEDRFIKSDGTVIDVDISISLIDENTGLTQGIVRDISQRKKAERALANNYHLQQTTSNILQTSMLPIPLEEQLQELLELILSLPFLTLESKGAIFLYSQEKDALEMKAKKNLSPEILKQCNNISPETRICGLAGLKEEFIFKSGFDKDHTITYPGMEAHGHYSIPMLYHQEFLGIIILYLTDGHEEDQIEIEFMKTIADTIANVIKRKRAESELIRYKTHLEEMVRERTEELIEAKEEAESANKLKTEFLANMSHELKTPLHGILGFAKVGSTRFKVLESEQIGNYFKDIHECGQRLLKLLNDLLDRSKLEAGTMTYTFSETKLSALVLIVINELSTLSHDQKVTVEFKEPDFDDTVILDRTKITQVLRNLVSNALKFSEPDSSIIINIDEEDEQLLLSVTDTGIGVSPEELLTIFEIFVQGSRTKTGAGGTGLGLAISKDIITAHKGMIWAENNASGGAIFRFRLPR